MDSTPTTFTFKLFIKIRRIAYICLGLFSFKQRGSIVVLCYHSVSTDNWRFSVDFETLKKQVEYLLKTRKPMTVNELEAHVSGHKPITEPAFLLSFDDGYQDVMKTKDYFKTKDITPLLFVMANTDQANRAELETQRPFLSKENILELQNAGWGIGSHTITHPNISELHGSSLVEEVANSKTILEKKLGIPVRYFSYPKGKYSPEILAAVKKGSYAMAFSMDEGFVTGVCDPMIIPRIGVDRTHTFSEFKAILSPVVINFRIMVRKLIQRPA